VSNSGFNNATLIQVMTNHINQLMGRYKGKCTHWDVVNEALNEDGTYRDNVFLRVIGEAYIPIAFRIAAAADPAAKLYYNDYNLEYLGPKLQGAVRIVKLVQSYGVKIDGVGYQGHLTTESTPTQSTPTPSEEDLTKALKMTADLGVDVAYTELDIRMRTPSNSQKQQALADAYARVGRSCLNVKRCVGITLWVRSPIYLLSSQRGGAKADLFFHRASRTSTRGCRAPSAARATRCSGTATSRRRPPTTPSCRPFPLPRPMRPRCREKIESNCILRVSILGSVHMRKLGAMDTRVSSPEVLSAEDELTRPCTYFTSSLRVEGHHDSVPDSARHRLVPPVADLSMLSTP
jgi:endo-1,4-beta-xylanase